MAEDIVHGAAMVARSSIFCLLQFCGAYPPPSMIGELSSALPFEGGITLGAPRYGQLLGFQEAWLSLVASIFDMAIYPTLFVLYLNRLFPWFAKTSRADGGSRRGGCRALLNIAGVRVVSTTSLWLFFALVGAVCADGVFVAFKFGALANAGDQADNFNGRYSWRPAHLHVVYMGGQTPQRSY